MTTDVPVRPAGSVAPVDAPDPNAGKRKVYRRTEEAKAYLVVFGARLRRLRDDAA